MSDMEKGLLGLLAMYEKAVSENERLRAGLERIALPIAFHVPKLCDPEHTARMFYAKAILDGADPKSAEAIAVSTVKQSEGE